jgi:hypothetical protein
MTQLDLIERLNDRGDCGEVINLLPAEFNHCLLGTMEDLALGVCRTVYDRELVIGVLQSRDKMTYEDAVEYFEFNIAGAFVAPAPPVFVETVNR